VYEYGTNHVTIHFFFLWLMGRLFNVYLFCSYHCTSFILHSHRRLFRRKSPDSSCTP